MTKKWINWINIGFAALLGLCLLLALIFALSKPRTITPLPPVKQTLQLPKPAFEQPQENYKQLNAELFKLKRTPPTVLLPNLKNVLTYYGKNSRLDANSENPLMHFGLQGTKDPVSIPPKEKLYLLYDRSGTPAKYVFSPNNKPTPLWIEATPYTSQAQVNVFLEDEGKLIRKPSANAQFMVQEKEYVRYGGTTWEMDKWRVDGTLLARQKARWYGQDLFLDKHGGEEFAYAKGKQRIDFGEGDDAYSIFLGENSCVIWKDGRWKNASPGESTREYPLMCVKKIDARLINLELWDINGRGKVMLNLLKSIDTPLPKTLQQNLKFVGARTLSQFLFEINNNRIMLRPHDWLIYNDNQWQLLKDPATIKRYVDRKLIGPLFVLQGVPESGDRQILKGVLYNPTRTEAMEIELPLVPPGGFKKDKKPEVKGRPLDKDKMPKTFGPGNKETGAREAAGLLPSADEEFDDEEDDIDIDDDQ